MSSQTERLERAAAEERERLGEHLNQLQQRLERALDPAALFDRHPLPILATALVGGVILGAVTRSDGPSEPYRGGRHRGSFRGVGGGRYGWLQDGFAQVRGALVGMVFARLAEKVQDLTHGDPDAAPRTPKRSPTRPVRPAAGAAPEPT